MDLWWLTRVLFYLSHARLWVRWAPGIPHALLGRKINAQLGRIAPRECGTASQRHCERSEAIQLTSFLHKESWIASSLALLAMTVVGCLKISKSDVKRSVSPL